MNRALELIERLGTFKWAKSLNYPVYSDELDNKLAFKLKNQKWWFEGTVNGHHVGSQISQVNSYKFPNLESKWVKAYKANDKKEMTKVAMAIIKYYDKGK